MNKLVIFFSLFFAISANNAFAQTLTIKEMIRLMKYKDSHNGFQSIDEHILEKGFDFVAEGKYNLEGLGKSKRYSYKSCEKFPIGSNTEFREANSISVDSTNHQIILSFTTGHNKTYLALLSEIDSLGFENWFYDGGFKEVRVTTKDYYSNIYPSVNLTLTIYHPSFEAETYPFYTLTIY